MRFLKKFDTLNYSNVFLFEKYCISSKESKNKAKLRYLSKYLSAINNELNFGDFEGEGDSIWQLWLQGYDKMPDVVKMCHNSVKKHNKDKDVVLLTSENLFNYVQLPDYIIEKHKKGIISNTHLSDIIRLFLLCKYGGFWLDATIFMSDRMPCYIENSDFFVFKDLSACLINKNTTLSQFVYLCNALQKGAFTNSVSFIRSKNKNMILENTLKVILEYWKFENKMYDYLLISYILTLVIFQNQTLKEQFINANSLPTTLEYGMMQKCLFEHFDKKTYEEIKKITPIHKLTYKNFNKNIYKDSFINYLLKENLINE